jgi:hypothetical protein
LVLGKLWYDKREVQRIQDGAGQGQRQFVAYLNPNTAALETLPERGFSRSVQAYPPLRVPFTYRGSRYQALLNQPIRAGSTGIWNVYAIVADRSPHTQPAHTFAGMSRTRRLATPASALQRRQKGADAGNPAYMLYRDPVRVVRRELQHLGFSAVTRISTQLTMSVLEHGMVYDVTLIQPSRYGPGGIWLVSRISAKVVGEPADGN